MFDPVWLARLHARASLAPLRPRVALCWGEHVIGSVLSNLVSEMGVKSPSMLDSLLFKSEYLKHGKPTPAWRIGTVPDAKWSGAQVTAAGAKPGHAASLSASLAAIAQALHDANLGHVRHHWRNEQLGVCSDSGQRLGSVERGAVRPLGLATQAVHLHGLAPDGRVWVQQRALTKSNDPGLWDTLMGGMVSAHDTLDSALARETWEEAGIKPEQLHNLERCGLVAVRRPTADAGDGGDDQGIGYVVESIAWYRCTLPHGLEPANQDGEVAQFKLLARHELIEWLERDQFTLEAALILVAALDPGSHLGEAPAHRAGRLD